MLIYKWKFGLFSVKHTVYEKSLSVLSLCNKNKTEGEILIYCKKKRVLKESI